MTVGNALDAASIPFLLWTLWGEWVAMDNFDRQLEPWHYCLFGLNPFFWAMHWLVNL
jgi:hypothetical protein